MKKYLNLIILSSLIAITSYASSNETFWDEYNHLKRLGYNQFNLSEDANGTLHCLLPWEKPNRLRKKICFRS